MVDSPDESVWLAGLARSLQLYFKSFCANLKSVHGLYGTLSRDSIVIRDKAKALAEIGGLVNEHFSTDDCAKGREHLSKVRVRHLVRQVVDEQV